MENLKNGTEIKYGEKVLIYEHNELMMELSNGNKIDFFAEYNFMVLKDNFEILSEEDEEVDIQALNQYGTNFNEGIISTRSSDTEKEKEFRKYIVNNAKDIRTLIRVVKQLDKKIKEKE